MRELTSPRPIEILTLALCLLILLSLALPRLQTARSAAREMQCQRHLAQLGSAFTKLEESQRGFPPRRTGFNNGKPYGGWGCFVIAHIEGMDEPLPYDFGYDFFDPHNKAVVENSYSVFLCPESPEERFVEIQSQATTKSLNADKDTVFKSRAAVTDFITSNGVLMTDRGYGIHAFGDGQRVGNQRQPMSDDEVLPVWKITDGLSNTLLLIEQAGRPAAWRGRTKQKGTGQFGLSPNARGAWAGWGSIAFGAVDQETFDRPGRGDGTDQCVNANNWLGIYGFHKEGANVLLCDGSVRFVSRELDPLTFAYLTVRDDGHLIRHDDY